MNYAYAIRYSIDGIPTSIDAKSLKEIKEIVANIANGSDFLLFEYKDPLEKSKISDIEVVEVAPYVVEGLDGTRKSVIYYLNNINKSNSRV